MKLVEISLDELRVLITEIVDARLRCMLADPDEGLELREDLKARLLELQKLNEEGKLLPQVLSEGISLEQLAAKHGIDLR